MRNSIQGILAILFIAIMTAGCFTAKARVNDPTDLRAYVDSSHKAEMETKTAEGSLWSSNGYYSSLYRDPKARFVNDMLTIVVSENTQAVATANAKSSKATAATAGFDKLLGLEKHIGEIPTMVSGKSDSSFEGKGSTARTTTLSTTLTARVIDVLPNGYLVVEGKREIHVNNENQSVFLTGIVRPEDINQFNRVPSSAVAQMSVRVQGRGVVSQPTKPGWLYKILNGILPF
jgi:flagellar L-ring protein FlgH